MLTNANKLNNIIQFKNYITKDNTQMKMDCLREFKGYYEYCFIKDYEDKYCDFDCDSIQIDDVFATILSTKKHMLLISILFPKNKFNLGKINKWLEKYKLDFVKSNSINYCIKDVSNIITGISFHGNIILMSTKGSKTLEFNPESFTEVTKEYKEYIQDVNISHSKNINFDKTGKKISLVINGLEVTEIPKIQFDSSRDIVISNGNNIIADYMGKYNSTIGFYNADNPIEPVSYIADDDTKIMIDIIERENGSRVFLIEYNYIIYTDKL